jgi:hypothetical protein
MGRWLQDGVLVGERELQCPTRRCGRPYDFQHLQSCVGDLVLKALRRRLRVGWLCEGGGTGPLGAAGPRPPCHPLWIVL